jgi:hypothetical protein
MTWILDAAIYGLLLVMELFCCFYFWFQFYTSGHKVIAKKIIAYAVPFLLSQVVSFALFIPLKYYLLK